MTAVAIKEKNPKSLDIPSILIYEELNGRKLYRKGYKNYLNKTKTIEEIMGSSSLQGAIISVLLSYLFRNVEDEGYEIMTNEAGLHVTLGVNLSSDIILYKREDFLNYRLDEHYFNVAPKIVIEVDIKIELEEQNALEYVNEKTKTLLDFGVEHVIWFFSKDKTVFFARPNQDWLIRNWTKDFELLPDHILNVQKMIEAKGYKI